jgi:hypothetical protein
MQSGYDLSGLVTILTVFLTYRSVAFVRRREPNERNFSTPLFEWE